MRRHLRHSIRPARACAIAVAWLLSAHAGPLAWADVVVLANGDHVSGEVQISELHVATPGSVVRLEPGELVRVTLGTIAGDVVWLRTGRTITGRVSEAAYTIRLDSGQTIVMPRGQVDELYFRPRR
jgi:hypothetical protein